MGAQPAQIPSQVRAARTGTRRGRSGTGLFGIGHLIQAPMFIVFDELLVALPGRTSGAHETT
ncbi:MAG: hypothetical protein DMD58_08755 [Gemmatimonadetes bacterium]|nr:MAG: hypothetical protein DMD58_08755 [Gemmatimonadota bacterium]